MSRTALTPRERDVVAGGVAGQTDRQIAEALGISLSTEKRYLYNVMN